MRLRSSGVGAALLLALVGSAAARDICVVSNGGVHWRFYNVQRLRPGKAVALTGIFDTVNVQCPVAGTAALTTGNQLRAAVAVYCQAPIAQSNFTLALTGTPDFDAAGQYDANGDNVSDGNPFTWTPEDCSTAPVP